MNALPNKTANYGLDAPYVVRNFGLIGALCLVIGLAFLLIGQSGPYGVPLRDMGLTMGIVFLLMMVWMYWGGTRGKLRDRDRLLALIPWRGDETVLDVGCGRGLLLIGAAKRLTTGKAVGVDLWSKDDLAGNRPEATRENAVLESVVDRVEIKDGDARQMPFADATFDVIVSRAVLHNIYNAAHRQQAVREIARVLKAGGRVALLDIVHTGEYAKVLTECGLTDVRRVGSPIFAGLLLVLTFGNLHPFTVTGRKPVP
ncbi:MAG TPA: class I SAM-dependent methyltransferase [Gemmataceae bacterium]|nr:class I SAM-dependent methyltransferase [Gemmataceae bacterium]